MQGPSGGQDNGERLRVQSNEPATTKAARSDEVDFVSGRTRVYGIVGDPIEQVRSPEMITAEFVRAASTR